MENPAHRRAHAFAEAVEATAPAMPPVDATPPVDAPTAPRANHPGAPAAPAARPAPDATPTLDAADATPTLDAPNAPNAVDAPTAPHASRPGDTANPGRRAGRDSAARAAKGPGPDPGGAPPAPAVAAASGKGPGPAPDPGPGRPGGPVGPLGGPAAEPFPGPAAGRKSAARGADPAQSRMLAIAAALEAVPRPTMDAETKIVQRAQLIAAMEAAVADGTFATATAPRAAKALPGQRVARVRPAARLPRRPRWTRRLAAGGLSLGVAAGALGGVAAASTGALPGDTLYGVKRGMEDVRLDMASGDEDRGKVYLDLASTRMQEANRLMERQRSGKPLDPGSLADIRRALSGMQQEASEGHRLLTRAYRKDGSLAPMATLSAFSAKHSRSWAQLRDRLPSQLGDVSDRVTSVFTAIRHDVAPLQGVLPPDARTGGSAAHPSGTPSGPAGTRRGKHAAPSASGHASPGDGSAADGRRDGTGRHRGTASPTPSQSTGSGLIGGNTGGLLPGTGGGTGSGGDGSGESTATPKPPAVTLPPLLPGLLPSLGLSADDDTGNTGT